MNNYCKTCANKAVPSSIKKKFNEEIKETFLECPSGDSKVAGCLIKERMNINWDSICNWLNDNGKLTVQEAVTMAKLGHFKEKKGV